jgi:hypothetical protein
VHDQEGFVEAKSDDGLLEIVGFRDGWHTAFVMISVLTAVRLCQVHLTPASLLITLVIGREDA